MTTLRRIDKCKACSAPILWAETSSGKKIPIDAAPVANGNVVLYDGPGSGKLLAFTTLEARAKATELFQSHSASCPEPKTFRRRRPKGLRKTTP
jgi:hypothetical protein